MKRLAGLAVAAAVLSACGGGDDIDTCGPFINYNPYDIVGLEAKAVSFEQLPERVAYEVNTTELTGSDIISEGRFIIELDADTEQGSTTTYHLGENADFWQGLSIFNKAYACSPPPPYTNEVIESITITSDRDFSVEYPAGSSLNELFVVAHQRFGYVYDENSDGERIYKPLNDFLNTQPSASMFMQLMLTQTPESEKSHQFTIDYKHTDGEQFTISTTTVNFE